VPFQSSTSLYQCTLLPVCTVATFLQQCASIAIQLLYAIPVLTVTISVHTVTNKYGSHSFYSNVPVLQFNYCMPFQSSLSLKQCTLLPTCTVATSFTAMCQYCSSITVYHSNPHCHYKSAHCYQYVR